MELVLIAAVDRAGAIGKGPALLWRNVEDLERFRQITLGWPVIMGRKTWDSLPPSVRPLKDRLNIVVTRNPLWSGDATRKGSLDEALSFCEGIVGNGRAFVIGGGELYAQAIDRADRLLLTEVEATFEGADVFFPSWRREAFVREPEGELRKDTKGIAFRWNAYQRLQPALGA